MGSTGWSDLRCIASAVHEPDPQGRQLGHVVEYLLEEARSQGLDLLEAEAAVEDRNASGSWAMEFEVNGGSEEINGLYVFVGRPFGGHRWDRSDGKPEYMMYSNFKGGALRIENDEWVLASSEEGGAEPFQPICAKLQEHLQRESPVRFRKHVGSRGSSPPVGRWHAVAQPFDDFVEVVCTTGNRILRRINALETYRANSHCFSRSAEVQDGGRVLPVMVFIDWSCLPQMRISPAGDVLELRTPEDESRFRSALSNMHVLYAHCWTCVLRLDTHVPPESSNPVEYFLRGWCRFEHRVSATNPYNSKVISFAKKFQKPTPTADAFRVPLTPVRFQEELSRLYFTSRRTDLDVVAKLYARVFESQMKQIELLRFTALPSEEVPLLLEVLPMYLTVKELSLNFTATLGDSGVAQLAGILPNCCVTRLLLCHCGITDTGIDALVKALPACDSLEFLAVDGNDGISAAGVASLRAEWIRACKRIELPAKGISN